MNLAGNIEKMLVEHAAPVRYALPIGEQRLELNPLLGRTLSLSFEGRINCIHCGRRTSRSFQQGYCYPCMQRLARCDLCIVKPETCHYHLGTCREPAWGEANCMIDHIVYLANSAGLKVGITRHTQIPTRWIDQGANAAIPLARVASRFDSGKLEVALKDYYKDKTNWRDMLKNKVPELDLVREKAALLPVLKRLLGELDGAETAPDRVYEFSYPVLEYPHKVQSLGFDKLPRIEGQLMGIKGQYLILDTGVLNIRKHGGYHIGVAVPDT